MTKILAATRNKGKFKEIKSILSIEGITLVSLDEFDVPEVVENKATFKGNAVKKACEVSEVTGFISISDDSGLEVDALDGRPGVHSSRFAGPQCNDKKNIEKLLLLLKEVPREKRTAQFKCLVAMADRKKVLAVASGICRGRIAFISRGEGGFGYDPVFIPEGYDKTFAELPGEIKNKISHRYKAFSKIKEELIRLKEIKAL